MNRKIIKQQYVIFGCGGFLERKLEEIEQVIDIVCICDNNKNMWGKKWRDKYECVSPDELINYIQYEVLISVEKEAVYREIEGQLCKNNFKCKHLNEVLSKAWIDNNMPIIDEELSEVIKTNIPRIFLLGAPAHSNLGDQAQTYCIQNLVEGVYPERRFFVFEGNPLRKDYYYLLYIIKNIIRPDDKILVHSGYHCTDLFQKEEDLNEKIVQLFLDKKLIFFPQTIFFKGKEALEKSKKIYNSHSDLTIMCRDIVSYGLAKEYYDKCNLVLFPDVVTSLIGKRKYTEDRRGILLCLRGLEYEESNITSEEKEQLIQGLKEIDNVILTDTDSPMKWTEIRKKRKDVIENEIKFYSQFKMIVTDRYHGMIFALIANTPVIVLPSTDHKLSSGVKWFPTELYRNISFENSIDKICVLAKKVHNEEKDYTNPTFLYDEYFKEIDEYLKD